MPARVVDILRAGAGVPTQAPADTLVLPHDERHVRRRTLRLLDGSRVLVDLAKPTVLQHGDRLVLEDGREIGIEAAPEAVYEVRGRDGVHLLELAWHVGNRHLAAEVHPDRICILQDPVIRTMLMALGADITQAVRPFVPVRGAYATPDGEVDQHHHHHEHH